MSRLNRSLSTWASSQTRPVLGLTSAHQQLGHAHLSRIDVSLHLHQGYRRLRQLTVGKLHRVVAIFPALVAQAPTRFTFVLREALAVQVAIVIYPIQRSYDVGKQIVIEVVIRRPAHRLDE